MLSYFEREIVRIFSYFYVTYIRYKQNFNSVLIASTI